MKERNIPLLIMLGLFIIAIITASIATALGVPIVGVEEAHISIASFDYWTVGHFLWGLALFVLAFTLGWIIHNLTGKPEDPINDPEFKKFVLYWVIILILAVIWEIIENTLLYAVGIKVKFDSVPNMITDVTIWSIGGCVGWYMTDLMFLSDKYLRAYYVYGFMSLTMGVLIFVIFGFIATNY
ncbi:hypothetical protein LCGC14_2428100 [marine sediment metagenome]|uniref:Uncharacterized protein n=1 Tax=marine sediment metagenome TaxID=412755 RepID=A0A0F9CA11_9ZZZZ